MALLAHWPLDGRLKDTSGNNYNDAILNRVPYNNVDDFKFSTGGLVGSFVEKIGRTSSYQNLEFLSKKDFKNHILKYKHFSVHMFIRLVEMENFNNLEIFRTCGSFPVVGNNGFWLNVRDGKGLSFHTENGWIETGIRLDKYLGPTKQWISFYYFIDFSRDEDVEYTIIINDDTYSGRLEKFTPFGNVPNVSVGGYNASNLGTGFSSIKLYDSKLSLKEIDEIRKLQVLHFKFEKNEVTRTNLASSQDAIEARVGITISGQRKVKTWNLATISGTTSQGDGRKGIFKIPVNSTAKSGKKYSVSIEFRLIGDDMSKYYIQVVSNRMAGNPHYEPTRIENDRYYFENIDILYTFDICLYSKVNDYVLPERTQILWRNVLMEPMPICGDFFEGNTYQGNSITDSSCFGNNGIVGGLASHLPLYDKKTNSYTFYNNGSANTLSNINTTIPLTHNHMNDEIFEITIMAKIRGIDITGYGLIAGYANYRGIGISVYGLKLSGYLRTKNNLYHIEGCNVNDSVFHDVALVYVRKSNKLRFIIDGKIIDTLTLDGDTFDDRLWDATFGIAKVVATAGDGWISGNFEIADVQVFRKELSLSDIISKFNNNVIVTKSGVLKSKFKTNIDNNIVNLDPVEYLYSPVTAVSNHNILASYGNHLLIRGLTNDSFTPRYVLSKPIKIGDSVKIEFDTVASDNCSDTIGMELFLFKYMGIDPPLKNISFYHDTNTSIVQSNNFEFTAIADFNFFRLDVNNSKATILFKNITITINGEKTTPFINSKINSNRCVVRSNPSKTFQTNLVDYLCWSPNQIDGVRYFNPNKQGDLDDAKRMIKLNPWNKFDIVWASEFNDSTSDADGGFITSGSNRRIMDHTKCYRYSCWIRRETLVEGRCHFGPRGSFYEMRSGELNSNPYFASPIPSDYPEDVNNIWLLMVYYILPYGRTEDITDSGFYKTNGVKLNMTKSVRGNFRFSEQKNIPLQILAYLYYTTVQTERAYWYRPRVDLCDGTEPSITELLNGTEHPSIIEYNHLYNPTFPVDRQFIEIKYAHGARWGKIFYHNNNSGTDKFTNDITVFLKCNTTYKKSILYALPYMRDIDNKFEFLLEYDSTPGYNRWKQTSVFTEETIAGYEPIHIDWNSSGWGGLEPYQNSMERCFVDGSVKTDECWYALGVINSTNFETAFPGPSPNTESKGVHLWVRIPEVAYIDNKTNNLVVTRVDKF